MIEEILEKLDDERVLKITPDGNMVHFDEQCDDWFRCSLTREETKALGEYLVKLSNGGDRKNPARS